MCDGGSGCKWLGKGWWGPGGGGGIRVKTLGKPQADLRQTSGKPLAKLGQTSGKPQANLRQTLRRLNSSKSTVPLTSIQAAI